MAKVVEKTAQVGSAPETVWGLLVNLESWKTWWGDCIEAHTEDTRTLREGSKIELVLRPRHRKVTLWPTVDMMTEGRTLSMTHRSAILQATVVWTVAEGPAGARIQVRGVFEGFQVWVMGLFGQNEIFTVTLSRNLRGLKKLAEKMV